MASSVGRIAVTTDRSLLNVNFEGYQLSSAGAPIVLFEHTLDVGVAPLRAPDDFSYKKLRRRSGHNYLFARPGDAFSLYYVDADMSLVCATVESDRVTTHTVVSLPLLADVGAAELEPPSLVFASAELAAFSPGDGRVAILRVQPNGTVASEWTLSAEALAVRPGRGLILHSARATPAGHLVLCASAAHETVHESGGARTAPLWKTTFETYLITLGWVDGRVQLTRPTVTLTSNESPLTAHLDSPCEHVVMVGTGAFVGPRPSAQPTQPARMDEASNSAVSPPAYHWTQTDSDLVVYIPLPSPASKSHVTCRFERDRVSLKIAGVPVGPFGSADLHGTIVAGDSVWTLEDERLITLYLEKDDRFRWSHLFTQDDGVLETIDPSDLAAIRERLERLTAPFAEDSARQMPSFEAQALDRGQEECDRDAQSVTFHRFTLEGQCTHVAEGGGHDWLCLGLTGANALAPMLGLKLDVDMLAFAVDADAGALTHKATFNALAYVQASKRLRRFVTFTPDMEWALIVESKRYVYVYARAKAKASRGRQHLVDLGDDVDDEFVGVAALGLSRLALLSTTRLIVIQLV